MQTVTTIGFDTAKSVFQVHGVDAAGEVVIRRQLKRRYVLAFFQKLPPCLVGIEACASSHYWSRELQALGHTVRLMPPAYVKPYVKRQKNDAGERKPQKEPDSGSRRARIRCSANLPGWSDRKDDRHRAGESQNRPPEPRLQHPPSCHAGAHGYRIRE